MKNPDKTLQVVPINIHQSPQMQAWQPIAKPVVIPHSQGGTMEVVGADDMNPGVYGSATPMLGSH